MKTIDIDNQALFDAIVTNPAHHARFLNTLSLMELCGALRLSRLLYSQKHSSFLLEHCAEEYRHAYYLRHVANKIANTPLDDYQESTVWCLQHSKRYISTIDRKISLALAQFELHHDQNHYQRAYCLSTLAIELRALPFYRQYQSVLDDYGIPISIKSVISEEEHHLEQIQELIKITDLPEALIGEAIFIEHKSFRNWSEKIYTSITGAAPLPVA